VLQVRDECRSHLHQQVLQFGIAGVRDQGRVEGFDDLLVVGNLVVDVGPVKRRPVQLAQRREIVGAALRERLTGSFVTRLVACVFTAVWSVTICCANLRTSGDAALPLARLPASMSTWLAVTTMAAICASSGAAPAWTGPARSASAPASAATAAIDFCMA
jgi:hypothetical protein